MGEKFTETCKKCRTKMERGVNFCPHCGEPVMKGTEETFEDKRAQNNVHNFFMKHSTVLALIVLCAVILTAVVINMNRQSLKEDFEMEQTVETTSVEDDYREEENLSAVEKDFEENDVQDVQADSSEEIANVEEDDTNINGNTNMNLKNGGWVAEQGDWNYYLLWNCILKENVTTGEKLFLYEFEDASEVNFNNLHVMGEWIYFSSEGMDNHIFRIPTNGGEYQSLETEWSNNILAWDTWNDKVYVIVKEYTSVQSYIVCAAAVDWENGTYEKMYELFDSDVRFYIGFEEQFVDLDNAIYHYIGMNDGYLYIYRDKNVEAVMVYDLEKEDLIMCPCNWSFHITDIYVDDSSLYGVGYSVKPGRMGNDLIQRSLGFINLSTLQEYEYNEIGLSEYDEINEINRIDDGLMVVGSSDDGISTFESSDETVSNVVPDIAKDICVAHNKIYYKCDGMYCEVNVDGSSWKEINEEEFLSDGVLGRNGINTQSALEGVETYKAYYEFLAQNESGFAADMGEFEKRNEENYEKTNAFLLVDLDQDGVQELVVQHPYSYKSDRLYVYTYQSGKVVQVKNVDGEKGERAYIDMNSQANGSYGVFGCGQNHLHVVWNAADFGIKDSIFIVKKGKLELYAEREEIDELGVDSHQIDGEEVDRGEYIVFLEGCGGELKNLEGNTESNREKYLK